MPKVTYSATGFSMPLDGVNGTSDMDLSWSFLLWSAITVGRAELIHIFRYGDFSLFEIAYRAALLFANLCDNAAGRIRRSEAYDGLDPSEKSAVSYFLGLTMAKAFAERLLGAPWLMHLDVYREELKPILAGRSRPDLVGRTVSGDWIGIESKGRTRGFDLDALNRAKAQAGTLASVNGQVPIALIGMVTHFGDGQLQLTTSDPPARDDHERIRLPLTGARLLEAYYRPFRTWLEREPQARIVERGGIPYRVAPVAAIDVTVGLAMDTLLGNVSRDQSNEAPDRFRSEGIAHYVGRDGVLVEVGPMWSTENMNREPQERTRSG
jgi:hypothetical protein